MELRRLGSGLYSELKSSGAGVLRSIIAVLKQQRCVLMMCDDGRWKEYLPIDVRIDPWSKAEALAYWWMSVVYEEGSSKCEVRAYKEVEEDRWMSECYGEFEEDEVMLLMSTKLSLQARPETYC